jgi:hypothetical protein
MKRKSLPKSLFVLAAVFSLTAFLFVNVHANLTIPQQICTQTTLDQPQVQECEEAENQEVKIPDISVLGRVIDLAQRFLPITH